MLGVQRRDARGRLFEEGGTSPRFMQINKPQCPGFHVTVRQTVWKLVQAVLQGLIEILATFVG